ncbi:MAG: hypothetical protein Q9221_003046 [Calogaya cf. arnoldii]
MVSMWNYKENDTKNTLRLSEALFQGYLEECDEEKELKNFQFLGVQNIINTVYLDVALEIFAMQTPSIPKLPDKYERWTYKDNQDDFLAFLGTPKLAFLLRMLKDHTVRFDKRIPVAIYTNYRRRSVFIIIEKYEG